MSSGDVEIFTTTEKSAKNKGLHPRKGILNAAGAVYSGGIRAKFGIANGTVTVTSIPRMRS
jgi:hypothetical protein